MTNATHALNIIMAKQLEEAQPLPPLYKRFGRLLLPDGIGINAKYIDLSVLITNGEILAKDEFNDMGGLETIDKGGDVKAKLIDSGVIRIPKLEALEILQGPNTPAAVKFRQQVANGMAALDAKIVNWVTAGPTIATDKDWDVKWRAPLVLKAATGTIDDPQDMSTVPGTSTNYGTTNFSGAGKSVDAIGATFSIAKVHLATFADDFSKRGLLRNDGTDRFTAFVNPAFLSLLQAYKPDAAAAVLGPRTYAEDLAALGIDLMGTSQLSWTGAVDATTNVIMVPNIADEIVMSFLPGGQPQAEPLKELENHFYTRIWCKLACAAKRHTYDAGTTIYKAVAHFTVTPNGA